MVLVLVIVQFQSSVAMEMRLMAELALICFDFDFGFGVLDCVLRSLSLAMQWPLAMPNGSESEKELLDQVLDSFGIPLTVVGKCNPKPKCRWYQVHSVWRPGTGYC